MKKNQNRMNLLSLFIGCLCLVVLFIFSGCGGSFQYTCKDTDYGCGAYQKDGLDLSVVSFPMCGGCISSGKGCSSCLYGERCSYINMENYSNNSNDNVKATSCSTLYYGCGRCGGCGSQPESSYAVYVSSKNNGNQSAGCVFGATVNDYESVYGKFDDKFVCGKQRDAEFAYIEDYVDLTLESTKQLNKADKLEKNTSKKEENSTTSKTIEKYIETEKNVTSKAKVEQTVPASTQESQKITQIKEEVDDFNQFDIDNSVVASINSDGTIKLEYTEVPMTMTLPSSWKGKFVVRDGNLYSKTAFYSEEVNDGKLINIIIIDEENSQFRLLGKSDNKYCYFVGVTDVRYDFYNNEESDEYNSLYESVYDIIDNIEFEGTQDSSVEDNSFEIMEINPPMYGEIASNGLEIEGYTSDYVCYGGAKTRQWICEDTWHITAKRFVESYGICWYECWDTDDGDYYGWIDSNFLYFY